MPKVSDEKHQETNLKHNIRKSWKPKGVKNDANTSQKKVLYIYKSILLLHSMEFRQKALLERFTGSIWPFWICIHLITGP